MLKNYIILVGVGLTMLYLVFPREDVTSSMSIEQVARQPDNATPTSQQEADPTVPLVLGSKLTLTRGPGGHFFTKAKVNGADVMFVVDTGATNVALTVEDARRAGIHVLPHEFSIVGTGASGPVSGKIVELDRVAIGNRTVDDVAGAVLEHGEMSLLGQSFLSRVGKIEIDGDKMTIS